MATGLFTNARMTNLVCRLPLPLALVPGDTQVRCGLTPSNSYAFSWTRGHPNRLADVPMAPATGTVVVIGDSVGVRLVAYPGCDDIPVEWLTAKRRNRADYGPWIVRKSGYAEDRLAMDEAGVFALAARTVCGGGTQSNQVEYVHLEGEPYVEALGERQGPNEAGGRNHIGVASSQKLLALRNGALSHLGENEYGYSDAIGTKNEFSSQLFDGWKCNRFVADVSIDMGVGVPVFHEVPHMAGLLTGKFPPSANDWANVGASIPGWVHLPAGTYPEPGLLAAHPNPHGSGHCGVVDYDGWTISARQFGISRNAQKMLDGTCIYNRPTEDDNDY